MKRGLAVAFLIYPLLTACGNDVPVERSCYSSGHMAEPTCNYELSELATSPEAEGVRTYAYLHERNGELYLIENRDGTGVSMRVNKVLDAPANDVHWMVGHRVNVYGIFHHDIHSLDVYSIGYINEPDVPRPIPPYPNPSGVSSATDVERTDLAGNQPDGEATSPTAGDFFYFTHDVEGARICHEIWYTPEGLCHYRLDELVSIHEPPVVGVRLYGFLLSKGGNLHMATNREGTGINLQITQVDDVVPEWLTGQLVETGHLTGLNGQYFPETKTIRAFSFSYVNLPGETPFRIPLPDQRLPSTSAPKPTRCSPPRYGETMTENCIHNFSGGGQSSAE